VASAGGTVIPVFQEGVPLRETTLSRAAQTNSPMYAIRAAERVLDILDVLQGTSDGVTLGELARATKLPKSSAFRYLTTLEARGYVARDGGDAYRLGLALQPLRPRDLALLAAAARPHLEELCDRFGETTNLGVLDSTRVAYLEVVESPRAVRFAARRGGRDPIHSSALGKAIAANLREEEVRRILAVEGMPARTANTITDPERFLRELEVVRARGHATDNGENEEGGSCVGVALAGCRLPAALSLSAPTARLQASQVEEVAAALRRAARLIAAEVERPDA
jgi:IclR family transcriptional regulator, acetate operon repressor